MPIQPWDGMTAFDLVEAITIGDAKFAWVRGQLKISLAVPMKRYFPGDAGAMKEVEKDS